MSSVALWRAYSATGAAWQRGPGPLYDRLAEVLVTKSPVPLAGRRVLDLGAGTGAAARAVDGAGGTAVAADVAIGMLRAIDPAPAGRVVADAMALPFASASLGGVVAAFSLNHLPDPGPALREATRVVTTGSPILVSAYAADDSHPVKEATNEAAAELGWSPDPWVDEMRNVSMPVLATVDGARRVAEGAGLRDASVQRLEVGFPDLRADDLVAWRCGMAQLAPFVAALPAPQRASLHARAIELLGPCPPLVRRVVVIAAVA